MVEEQYGAGSPEAYAKARELLASAKVESFANLQSESRKRVRLVVVVALAWVAVTVVLLFVGGPDLLLVGEIGLAVVLIWAVFYLIPAFVGRSGLADAFKQYEDQLDKLESAGAPMPYTHDIDEMMAAVDYATDEAQIAGEGASA